MVDRRISQADSKYYETDTVKCYPRMLDGTPEYQPQREYDDRRRPSQYLDNQRWKNDHGRTHRLREGRRPTPCKVPPQVNNPGTQRDLREYLDQFLFYLCSNNFEHLLDSNHDYYTSRLRYNYNPDLCMTRELARRDGSFRIFVKHPRVVNKAKEDYKIMLAQFRASRGPIDIKVPDIDPNEKRNEVLIIFVDSYEPRLEVLAIQDNATVR